MSLSCARGERREWGRNEGVRLERRRGGDARDVRPARRRRCASRRFSVRTGAYHLVASALVHLRDPHVDEDQLRCRCRGHVHRHRQKGLGATGPHGPRPRARKEWQIKQRKKAFSRTSTPTLTFITFVYFCLLQPVLRSPRRCVDDSTRPRSRRFSWRFSSPQRARRRITRIPLAYPRVSMRMLKLPGTRRRT